ncbi:MAG: hypothetical protein V4542_01635 [Pseudomonadota bacterium]
MATNPIVRTSLTFTELMAHLQCSENDLRDAILSQQLVPSIFVKVPLWEMAINDSGKRSRLTPATRRDRWMYLVDVVELGSNDCAFNYYSDTLDAWKTTSVFKADGTGYIDIRKRMADVEREGRFSVEAIAKCEAFSGTQSRGSQVPAIVKAQWWNSKYDVWAIAKEIEKAGIGQGWGINQSGPRAQQYPISRISQAVAKKITDAETAAGQPRRIGGKTISTYLKSKGWK